MIQIILIIVGLVIIALIIFARREAERHGTSATDEFVGICLTAVHRMVAKQQNLEKIMAMFAEKPELSNAEVRQVLGVSSRTAVRYLDELEQESRIEQVGRVGHADTYRLK